MDTRLTLSYRTLVIGRGGATVSGYGKKHHFFTTFQQIVTFFLQSERNNNGEKIKGHPLLYDWTILYITIIIFPFGRAPRGSIK